MAKTIDSTFPELDTKQPSTAVKPAIRAGGWRTRQRIWWIAFIVPALVVYIFFMAAPLINSMGLSLYTGEGLRPDHFVGLDNYVRLFTEPTWRDRFFNAIRNTFVF